MRVKHITPKIKFDKNRQKISEFLNIEYDDIGVHEAPGTYIINIENNKEAQEAYKSRNPFGNSDRPNSFDFSKDILVRWQDNKLQAM